MSKHEWHSLEDCPDYAERSKGRRYARSQWTCKILPCDVKRHHYNLPYPKSGRSAHSSQPGQPRNELVGWWRTDFNWMLVREGPERNDVIAEVIR